MAAHRARVVAGTTAASTEVDRRGCHNGPCMRRGQAAPRTGMFVMGAGIRTVARRLHSPRRTRYLDWGRRSKASSAHSEFSESPTEGMATRAREQRRKAQMTVKQAMDTAKSLEDYRRQFYEENPGFTTGGTAPVSAETMSMVNQANAHNDLVRRVAELERRIGELEGPCKVCGSGPHA